MRIIVSDSSALIDLKKGGLLAVFLDLPFEFVVPDVLLNTELLSFAKSEIAMLRRRTTVASLDGDGMNRAHDIAAEFPALSVADSIALVVAEQNPGCILLTGDKRLRERAGVSRIECHGVLWIVEQIAAGNREAAGMLVKALRTWKEDFLVRLPSADLDAMIERLRR